MWRLLLAAMIAVAAAFACSWSYPIWIPRSQSADPLYKFDTDHGTGYIDGKGRVVISPASQQSVGSFRSEFHDGLLAVSVASGQYVDRTGKVVLDLGKNSDVSHCPRFYNSAHQPPEQ